ncbi:hypothetical protein [Nocardioides sp. SYSU DS0651]|uniref:hypothetical protein n=1 Tax=Nocardioides sp. SYSU DS0651 TaxID=3415955 RepID=UPI003F4B9CEC
MGQVLHVVRALLRRGPRFLITYFRGALFWDLRYRTKTHLRVPKPDADGDDERRDGLLYVASLTGVVRSTLDLARRHWGEERFGSAQFLDLGCGKGKALLVYAQEYSRPSSPRAVGVEYDAELTAVASANIARMGLRGRAVAHCDSAVNLERYTRPGHLVVYLYNSFQGETLRKVLAVLGGRPHILVYVDPVERDLLADYGYVIVGERQGRYNADTWLVAERDLTGP